MIKRIALIAIAVTSFTAVAQDDFDESKVKAEEIIYEKPTEWSVYASDEPVLTFAIKGDQMWYATASGVFCTSVKKRTVQPFKDLGGIPASDVTSIASDGKIVAIGGKNGVAITSGKSFSSYTAGKGLPDNSVNAIAVAAGKIWAGTDKGLAFFSGGEWKTFTTENGLSHNKVTALMIDGKGRLWAGTMKGISVYDGSSWKIHDMKSGMSWNNVKALAYDGRKKMVWAAVGENDVNSYKEGGEWNTFMDIREGITSIMADSQSRIWVGSINGLLKYNGDEWIDDPKKLNVPASQVYCMYRDHSGNLYYAAENGIVRLSNPYPF